jgi:hypothetical protein
VRAGCLFRLQAPLGGLLAALLPRAQIVPAVPLDQLSNDPIVVRAPLQAPCSMAQHGHSAGITSSEPNHGGCPRAMLWVRIDFASAIVEATFLCYWPQRLYPICAALACGR